MSTDSIVVLSVLGSVSLARIDQCHGPDGHFQACYSASFPSCSGARIPIRAHEFRCAGDEYHGAALRLLPSAAVTRSNSFHLTVGHGKPSNVSAHCHFLGVEISQRRGSYRTEGAFLTRDEGTLALSSTIVSGTTRKHLGQPTSNLLRTQRDRCARKVSPMERRETTIIAAATADSDQTFPSHNGGGEQPTPTNPHPEVHPADVVQAQLKALREKDLATVFEFASPNNKARTGPLSRFSEMLEGRAYNVMIGHVSAEVLSTMTISSDRFQQRVVIVGSTGNKATFLWSLSRQNEGPYASCWMTDAVRRDE